MIRVKVPFKLEDYDALESDDTLQNDVKQWLAKVSNVNKELSKAKTVQQHKATVEDNDGLWKDDKLKEWMLSQSNDKCWYTEVKCGAEYLEVEHFRPKGNVKDDTGRSVSDGYYWLAFNLCNYRLSKPMPNRKKGSYFPILNEKFRAKSNQDCHLDELPYFLDPLSPRDHLLLSFNDNGKAVPELDIRPNQIKRVTFTVKHLGLNHQLLNRRRKEVWKTTRQLFNRYTQLLIKADSGSIRAESKAEEVVDQLYELVSPSSEFSSVAKAALMKTGDSMAQKIAASS
ncbi:hypothetical protein L1D11_05685 [Vibrio sp. Isolate32]|uniref:hypothetical protein n=1 Tax=Vibrio sp. Isolate32 TaxID=2908538 RepID=UPI001EFCB953|nr:hypothetical protein [Vibrio sp. Isolate32]MCG9552884.1 hypothetical protein [Vibrio sp. Isolate32]